MDISTKQVKAGMYYVGENTSTSARDPPQDVYVIRGDVMNEDRGKGLHRIQGLHSSKWYVYTVSEELRNYHDRSGTGVLMVGSIESFHDTKADGVKAASRFVD